MISIETTIKTSWSAYYRNLKGWVLLMLPMLALVTIGGIFYKQFLGTSNDPQILYDVFTAHLMRNLIFVTTYFIVFLLASFWLEIALVKAADRALNGNTVSLAAYRMDWDTFQRIAWVSFLKTLVIIGGFFLFVIPGIIWSLRYAFAVPAAVLENKKGWNALTRSNELTRGRLLSLFSTMFVSGLVLFVGVAILNVVVGLLLGLVGTVLQSVAPANAVVGQVFGFVVTLAQDGLTQFTAPFMPLVLLVLYRDFRANHAPAAKP